MFLLFVYGKFIFHRILKVFLNKVFFPFRKNAYRYYATYNFSSFWCFWIYWAESFQYQMSDDELRYLLWCPSQPKRVKKGQISKCFNGSSKILCPHLIWYACVQLLLVNMLWSYHRLHSVSLFIMILNFYGFFFPSVLIYIIGLFISKYKCIYYVFHQFWST
jgi:hypothetical protein